MHSRKDSSKAILVVSISLFFISCGVPMTKGEEWLYSKKENPEINISGTWVFLNGVMQLSNKKIRT